MRVVSVVRWMSVLWRYRRDRRVVSWRDLEVLVAGALLLFPISEGVVEDSDVAGSDFVLNASSVLKIEVRASPPSQGVGYAIRGATRPVTDEWLDVTTTMRTYSVWGDRAIVLSELDAPHTRFCGVSDTVYLPSWRVRLVENMSTSARNNAAVWVGADKTHSRMTIDQIVDALRERGVEMVRLPEGTLVNPLLSRPLREYKQGGFVRGTVISFSDTQTLITSALMPDLQAEYQRLGADIGLAL